MRIVRGDLLELAAAGAFDVIVHGCNCMCTMGAGIARAIRERYPEAWEADRRTTRGDRAKLGTITCAFVANGGHPLVVVNAYTQYHWAGAGVLADYAAIRACMAEIARRFAGKRIGYPKIGAGLAGGDWQTIAAIIDEELAGMDHTCVEYQPQ